MWSLDDIRKLQQKKFRTESGFFVAEGEHLVQELIKASREHEGLTESIVYVTPGHENLAGHLPVQVISPAQMKRISDTHTPQGVLAVVPMSALPSADAVETRRAFYFHEIQDPGNLGSILRTLVWFGGIRCLLSPGSVDIFNPKVVRASMGALFHLAIETDVQPEQLLQGTLRAALLDMTGEAVSAATFEDFDVYIFGNEARGVPDVCSGSIVAKPYTIPGVGRIDSLNLASAVSICAFRLSQA